MTKTCLHCRQPFEIFPEDIALLALLSPVVEGEKYALPTPDICPLCRMQQRLSYRNERFLYHRKCDLSGKQIISAFSLEKPFPVYDIEEWWTDKWDALSFGRNFDFSQSFFEQFFALRNLVPRLARQQQKPMENSDYCNCASRQKNCYLVFSTNECEDCYYGSWVNQCRDCLDNLSIEDCELCYECTACRNCYDLKYSRDCIGCSNGYFLRNCQSCKHCFACSNQIEKQYIIFNKPVSKEKYEAFIKSIDLGSFQKIELLCKKVDVELGDMVVKEFHGSNLENSLGDYLRNCKNAFWAFECDNSEDVRYVQCLQGAKNCMDYSHWGQNAEMIYSCQACGYDVARLVNCNLCWSGCCDLIYCDHCFSCQDCFGCVGLKKKRYCIFNKQYTPQEYEAVTKKIIEYMQKTGEWGKFFPASQAIYAYNETLAHQEIPLAKEEAVKKGFLWSEEAEKNEKKYLGPVYTMADSITEADQTICQEIFTCSVTGRPYKIIPQELAFYKRLNIPLPRKCPDQRHRERFVLRNPRKLWIRSCDKCAKKIQTTYAPDRPEIVYCEECYLQTVY